MNNLSYWLARIYYKLVGITVDPIPTTFKAEYWAERIYRFIAGLPGGLAGGKPVQFWLEAWFYNVTGQSHRLATGTQSAWFWLSKLYAHYAGLSLNGVLVPASEEFWASKLLEVVSTAPVTFPVIQVTFGVTVVADGGSYAGGTHAKNAVAQITMTVKNTGTDILTLQNPAVAGSITSASAFSDLTLDPNQQVTSTITLNTATPGTSLTGTITIIHDAANPPYNATIDFHVSGIVENSFTYDSSIDALAGLFGRYAYTEPLIGGDRPIVMMMHGVSSNATAFETTVDFTRLTALYPGVFLVCVDKRGATGGSSPGSPDLHGRETQDIIDAIEYIRATFPTKVSATRAAISGYSAGGGDALSCAVKFPDYWTDVISHYGMSDDGEVDNLITGLVNDGGWWYSNTTYQATINTRVGNNPATVPNNYRARNFRRAAANSMAYHRFFHDGSDADVNLWHSQKMANLLRSAGNIPYENYTASGDSPRWSHGAYTQETESIWLPDIETEANPVNTVAATGTLIIPGWVDTKRFRLMLGTGDNEAGEVVYDMNALTFDVVSRTGATTYNLQVKGQTPSATVNITLNGGALSETANGSGVATFTGTLTVAPTLRVWLDSTLYADGSTYDARHPLQNATRILTLTLYNYGTSDLTVNDPITFSGDIASVGTITGASGGTAVIAAGASATVTVTLDTSALGAQSGSVTLVSDDPDTANYDITFNFTVYASNALALVGKGAAQLLKMTEAAGTTAEDATANNCDGTYVNTPALAAVASPFAGENAPTFNSAQSEYVNTFSATLAALWNFDEGTLGIWVDMTDAQWDAAAASRFIAQYTKASTWEVRLTKTGTARQISVLLTGGGRSQTITYTFPGTPAGWQYLLITWNIYDRIRLFVNASLVAISSVRPETQVGALTNSVFGRQYNGAFYFPGDLSYGMYDNTQFVGLDIDDAYDVA